MCDGSHAGISTQKKSRKSEEQACLHFQIFRLFFVLFASNFYVEKNCFSGGF